MKEVIALEMGFYRNSRVRKGEVFSVPDNYTAKWFKETSGVKATPKAAPEPDTFSAMNKLVPRTDIELRAELASPEQVLAPDAAEIFRDLAAPVSPTPKHRFGRGKEKDDV